MINQNVFLMLLLLVSLFYCNPKNDDPPSSPIDIGTPSNTLSLFGANVISTQLYERDLYLSEKDTDGKWKEARNLGEKINSDQLDYCPFVDSESLNFYFTSERMQTEPEKINTVQDLKDRANQTQNGFGNIYKIGFEVLEINKK